jgi:hypothetical protein
VVGVPPEPPVQLPNVPVCGLTVTDETANGTDPVNLPDVAPVALVAATSRTIATPEQASKRRRDRRTGRPTHTARMCRGGSIVTPPLGCGSATTRI